MLSNQQTIESIAIKIEAYGNTKLELIKLQATDKTAEIGSRLFSRTILIIFLLFFALFINIGIAFWLGELLGAVYFGFAIVAGFYLLLSLIMSLLHNKIVKSMQNFFIHQLLN